MNPSINEIRLKINPERTIVYLSIPIAVLLILHLIGQFAVHQLGAPNNKIFMILNMDSEKSLPTFFVIIEWLICVALLAAITWFRRKEWWQFIYWLGILLAFAFLTADEQMSIHEAMITPVRSTLKTSGLLFFAWIIPYSIALLILTIIYLRFMIALPSRTRWLFILACALFLSGALGIELFEGRHVEQYGRELVYALFYVAIEETLEMAGLLVFIYALMSYLVNQLGITEFRLGPARPH